MLHRTTGMGPTLQPLGAVPEILCPGGAAFALFNSFSLMAGLAAVTKRITLFALVAVLTIPPAVPARMQARQPARTERLLAANAGSGRNFGATLPQMVVAGETDKPRRSSGTIMPP